MKRKLIAFGAIAALSFGLAGCSGGGLSGDEAKVADRFESFFNGMVESDGEAACDVMLGADSAPIKDDEATYDICVSTYESMGSTVKDAMKEAGVEKIEVTKVVIDGENATVTAKGAGALGGAEDIQMKLVDGDWYFDFASL